MSPQTPSHDAARAHAADLCTFLDAAPSPYHAVAVAAERLVAAGFVERPLAAPWVAADATPTGTVGGFVRRDGTIIAWRLPTAPARAPFRIVGAHTDSPGFRIKPNPDTSNVGWRQLGVEVYGGPLINSWLDRDLGLAGRVLCRRHDGPPELRTLRDDRAVLRIPQLAIHLDRSIGDQGLKLDRQRHLVPVWGLGVAQPGDFARYLASLIDRDPADVVGWDLAPFDLAGARVVGVDEDLIASARLDNLVSCHAAIEALCNSEATAATSVVALFDHEEVGSTSATGAAGTLLAQVLERISLSLGRGRAEHLDAIGGSHGVSVDMAHATHPNYPERHEPTHPIAVGAGPALKVNAQQRYASDGHSQALLVAACDAAAVPLQRFVANSSMPCGSTIGPATAAGLGIPVVDVGVPQLAMHSVRELCGVHDPHLLTRALTHYFSLA